MCLWTPSDDASFEILMFRPGLNASLRNTSEIVFRGLPRFPSFITVMALI